MRDGEVDAKNYHCHKKNHCQIITAEAVIKLNNTYVFLVFFDNLELTIGSVTSL